MNQPDRTIDIMLERFDARYRRKKYLNLVISCIILVLGITSVLYILRKDREGWLVLRWMTVDGTIYTCLMMVFFIVVNCVELSRNTEMTRRSVYLARLSAAVAECVILVIVLISRLPFFSEHMHLTGYDMFNMHILIPLLTVTSFVLNDSPPGRLRRSELWLGTSFVTVYAAVIIALIRTGCIAGRDIPYFFFDFTVMSPAAIVGGFAFIYTLGCLLSLLLSRLNRRLYWRWFRNL